MIRFHMDILIVPGKTVELKKMSSVFAAADKKPFLFSFGRLSPVTFSPSKQNQTKAMLWSEAFLNLFLVIIMNF